MRILRSVVLSIGLMGLAVGCGGSSKGEETTPAAAEMEEEMADPCGGDMADPCGGDEWADPCGGDPCGEMHDDMDDPCGGDPCGGGW